MISNFKLFFTSCLGAMVGIVALFAIFFSGIGIIGGIAGLFSGAESNSVLQITLSDAVPEMTGNVEADPTEIFGEKNAFGLRRMTKAIEHAKTDDNIKGIYMELEPAPMGAATRSVLRNALLDFKKSGKFIVAYGTRYTQGSYYMSSVADKIYINPKGAIEWGGIAAQIPFFKGLFDKLGVKAQVYYAGKFKSATEPYRRNEMSPENKTQVREYMEGNYSVMLQDVSAARKIPYAELRSLADNFTVRTANDALRYKMVDGIKYKDEVLADLRTRLGLAKTKKINSIALSDYISEFEEEKGSGSEKIAVVYAEGSITDGNSGPGGIGGDTYSAMIRKIREDDDIKAIVLRVNSGGGSSLASEIIWRELQLCREAGKPVIVSMGDVAASGGYYIACNATKILAEPNTITGSIGVFGLIPNAGGFLRDKLGVTYDTLKTGKYSVALSGNVYYEFNEDEGKIIQGLIDTTYHDFLSRVAEGRKMSIADVDSIAQGRVWTGKKALALGLVDSLGGLQDAINIAAKTAKLKDYRLSEYPSAKTGIERLISKLKGDDASSAQAFLKQQLGAELYEQYRHVQMMRTMQGVQMRLPFVVYGY
jgi:protease IV